METGSCLAWGPSPLGFSFLFELSNRERTRNILRVWAQARDLKYCDTDFGHDPIDEYVCQLTSALRGRRASFAAKEG